MRTIITAAAAALAVGALSLPTEAAATAYTFGFDEERWGGDQTAGIYQGLRFTYDEGADDTLSPEPTLDVSGAVQMNEAGMLRGGWFALTPGGDPRQADDQIAIFYMDFESGRLSAYRYDGNITEGFYSFENPDLFIESWADAVTTSVTDGVLSFSIDGLDLSTVQTASDAAGYTGAAFGEEVGIWLHLSVMRDTITFDADGRLTSFRPAALASFDLPRTDAFATPLPGAAVFLLTGAAGLVAARRVRR